ncbi:KR domain-containing protein [Streptomyces sp. G45]|uniref:KR domain-containing protein n=1 Tax=Streptomyces sp. G45 TaxID=3406627 RepID=UPI003C1C7518
MSNVMIIGMGDMGERLATGLAAQGRTTRLTLVGRSPQRLADTAACVASQTDCFVEPVVADVLRRDDLAEALDRHRPDLVVQCASSQSPWALFGRTDAAARAVNGAGLALRLPYQLPPVVSVMRAVRDAGYPGPVANLSFPDVVGPILRPLGLAPTLGLGNAGIMLRRVRTALRMSAPTGKLPLVRIVGHHAQVFGVMQANEPADANDRCRVYLGAEGKRRDSLAYRAPSLAPGRIYNRVTAAATLPVLEALLGGGEPLHWSVPAPAGLPGGYPVRITDGQVTLDLPPGQSLEEAVSFNERLARQDGVERVEDDGTVHFTEACRAAVADIAPELADPLPLDGLTERAKHLDELLGQDR